ncbi:hypothetical protein CONLIGDRAFT_142233 [Coniochaeta ligniaria NRRL 30616]|uniref:Uncharacterized protein n=1 Tax=Coniochaeta ligniaria NRRL 30616 TaxID=1408157 RepID=A0A1J7I742_9PEZI|nr:hypothetical protein CONLIGDRAFT_142233 [Coniochaeta ligniaria NRRL 30616]
MDTSSQQKMTHHPALDAVLALQQASAFSTLPEPDRDHEHRGQQLSLQRIWELLPAEQRNKVRLEFGRGGSHVVRPLPLPLFGKLTGSSATAAVRPPEVSDTGQEVVQSSADRLYRFPTPSQEPTPGTAINQAPGPGDMRV